MQINRDIFRYLMGFGRDHADCIDYVLTEWGFHRTSSPSLVPAGYWHIRREEKTGTFAAKFAPHIKGWFTDKATLSISIQSQKGSVCEAITFPLFMLLSDQPGYQVYTHEFVGIDNSIYVGITKRGWRTRWSEHFRAANSGSHYRFHRAIQQWHGSPQIMSHHRVLACGLSEQAALSMEESLIDRDTLYPLGLNMIPGGNRGLAYLRSIGALGKNERVAPDDRQDIINRFFDRTSRKGLPNPLAAANWLDPSYAEQVICSGPDRLKPQQIRDARYLSSLGQGVDDIAVRVGARNVAQVQRMLAGSTYSRVI